MHQIRVPPNNQQSGFQKHTICPNYLLFFDYKQWTSFSNVKIPKHQHCQCAVTHLRIILGKQLYCLQPILKNSLTLISRTDKPRQFSVISVLTHGRKHQLINADQRLILLSKGFLQRKSICRTKKTTSLQVICTKFSIMSFHCVRPVQS